jgi:HlyD family secretion protein
MSRRHPRAERLGAGLVLVASLVFCACSAEESSTAVGVLERDRLDLVAEASEPVIERAVEEGAYVERSALIVKLDPTRLEAQVAQAEAGRARADARLAELVRGPRRERIAEARARFKGVEGRLATARNELDRSRKLIAEGVISTEQIEQRRADFDEALAARDAARATLDELLDGTTAEEVAQAEAGLAEAEAVLADARVRLSRLEVRAPIAGWVDALPYELGERPPAGGVVAVLLADDAPYARVYVPASIRLHVKAGTEARVRLDGVAEPLSGRVRTVATDASFTPYFALTEKDRGRLVYLSKVDLLDPAARGLPSGLPVVVEFELPPDVSEGIDVGARD